MRKTFRFLCAALSVAFLVGCAKNDVNKTTADSEKQVLLSDETVVTTAASEEGPFFKITMEYLPEMTEPALPEDFDYDSEEEEYIYAENAKRLGAVSYERIDKKVIGSRFFELDALYGDKYNMDEHPESDVSKERAKYLYKELGYTVRILNPDENGWETIPLKRNAYIVDETKLKPSEIIGEYDGKVYMILSWSESYLKGYEVVVNTLEYIGICGKDTEPTLLGRIPDDYMGYKFYTDKGKIYGYNSATDTDVLCFDDDFEIQSVDTDRWMQGISIDDNGNAFQYGAADGELWVSDEPEGDILYKFGEVFKFTPGVDYALSLENTVTAMNSYSLFMNTDDGTQYCRLSDQDIVINKCNGIYETEQGYKIFAELRDDDIILIAEAVEENPALSKKTITARVSGITPYLREVVTKFNMQNPNFRLVLIEQTARDYEEKLDLQLATGEAPDLIENYGVDTVKLAGKGAIVPLDELFFCKEDEYFESALKSGTVEEKIYVGPYEVKLWSYFTSKNISGDLDSWNMEQFMGCIEKSGASSVYAGDAESIIEYFVLYDTEGTKYIDWGKGESKLDEEPFIKALEFAKKYRGTVSDNFGAEFERGLIDGSIAGDYNNFPNIFGDMCKYDGYFKGEASYIGFPGEKRSGGYLKTTGFMINSGSENIEEAKAFLTWLISEQGQRAYVESSYTVGGTALETENFCILPVRKDIFDEEFEEYQKYSSVYSVTVSTSSHLLDYTKQPLTDEQADTYKRLIDEARPEDPGVMPIKKIVEEELGAFLEGQKSAEETAKVIDSRVQLYLDENR